MLDPLEEDDHVANEGDIFNDKYVIENRIGSGGFSSVWKCHLIDNINSKYAIKINKSGKYHYDCAKNELKILKKIFKNYRSEVNILKPLDWFMFRDDANTTNKYYCIIYELCDFSLYDLIDYDNKLDIDTIRILAKDIINGIYILHSEQIIHSDIKPDNILIKNGIAKIADYSSSDYEYIYDNSIVGTRYYRSPENLLGLNLSIATDIWALGCLLFEMATGKILFKPKSYHEWNITKTEDHLAQIIKYIGPIPKYMLNGICAHKYFSKKSEGKYTMHSFSKKNSKPKLYELFHRYEIDNLLFIDLVEQTLIIDPLKRITIKKCIEHPFLKN